MKKSIASNGKSLRFTALTLAAAASLALTACGAYDEERAAASASDNPVASVTTLVVSETWAKAMDSGMSSAFGTIKNPTGQDITILGASSAASKTAELHETVKSTDGSMKMRPKEGGLTVPAYGEVILAPGAEHIMMMGLATPLQAGDNVTIKLELSSGDDLNFTAQVKDFSGANEDYGNMDQEGADQENMDHEGMDGTTPADAK